MPATHDVFDVSFDVSHPLSGRNVVSDDAALVDAVRRHGGGSALDDLAKLGRQAGSAADSGARLPGTLPVGTDLAATIDRSTPVAH
jgi:hypothetical protein